MGLLAHRVLGNVHAAKTGWLVHGLFGCGRNLTALGKSLIANTAAGGVDWRIVLVDLRGHGGNVGAASTRFQAPHTLDACVDDLAQLAASIGAPDTVVGHSLGAKVSLAALSGNPGVCASPFGTHRGNHLRVCAIDPAIGIHVPGTGADLIDAVLRVVHAAPLLLPSRDWIAAACTAEGLPEKIGAWLAGTAVDLGAAGPGYRWGFDPTVAQALYQDHCARDLWPVVTHEPPRGVHVDLIVAGRSRRWKSPGSAAQLAVAAATPGVTVHTVDGGHWLHTDNLPGLVAALMPAFTTPT